MAYEDKSLLELRQSLRAMVVLYQATENPSPELTNQIRSVVDEIKEREKDMIQFRENDLNQKVFYTKWGLIGMTIGFVLLFIALAFCTMP